MRTASSKRPSASKLAKTAAVLSLLIPSALQADVGRELSAPFRLQEGQEFQMSLYDLLSYGERLFAANWTIEEGAGRPLTKGTGAPNAGSTPLTFPHNFNRISGPDANSCAGCHNSPVVGGNGDITANVFVLGQRFDFATLDHTDGVATRGSLDESGKHPSLEKLSNNRSTPGMFGGGYIEMLAREMTADLVAIRNALAPGASAPLVSKGVSFGTLSRDAEGNYITTAVEGLPAPSLALSGGKPRLIVRPFHQVGNVISLRQFTNNAMNHHHGIQPTERFGEATDPDGDSVRNEMTEAEVTAATLFQAAMAVPGRMIPRNPNIEGAVLSGESKFVQIGCASCHVPALPLRPGGEVFSEPSPYNPPGNRTPDDGPVYSVDLNDDPSLPQPRLRAEPSGVTMVPAFTDLKLHDITSGPSDPNVEPLDQNAAMGSPEFFAGNRKFLTRKLWGVASKPNFFHHGKFTTMREAILAHSGEALASRQAYQALSPQEQGSVIEFLKTLRNLPAGTPSTIVDEFGTARQWPPTRLTGIASTGDKVTLDWQGGTAVTPASGNFQLETSTDLKAWTKLGGATTSTALTVDVFGPRRFYRVRNTQTNTLSEPMGYVSQSVPAQTECLMTACLLPEVSFKDKIHSVNGNVVTLASHPGWANGQWSNGENGISYAAVISSGPLAGMVGQVTGNTANSITVLLQPSESLSQVQTLLTHGSAAANEIILTPYWTPKTLFTGPLPEGAQIHLYRSRLAGVDLAPSVILELTVGQWLDKATGSPAGDVALGFHEPFLLRNPAASPVTCRMVGTVATMASRMLLRTVAPNIAQDVRLGYLSPVPEKLGSAGLKVRAGDQLMIFNQAGLGYNKKPLKTLVYNASTGWMDKTTSAASTLLQPGQGYVLRMKAGTTVASLPWADLPEFLK